MWRKPNICATRPDVGGTVASHRKPVTIENRHTVVVLMGTSMNSAMTSARSA
jgi:hypothetical protein